MVEKDGQKVLGDISVFDWNNCWTLWAPESGCVSEIYAIAVALRKIKYFRPFLNELAEIPFLEGLKQEAPTIIWSDCQAGIKIGDGEHPGRFKVTKHLERRYFGIQQDS